MKRAISFATLMLISSCTGVHVPQAAVANSGVIGSWREGSSVSIVYQKSSTTDQMLLSEATTACRAIGKRPGSRADAKLNGAGNIPGVDGKVIYQCV